MFHIPAAHAVHFSQWNLPAVRFAHSSANGELLFAAVAKRSYDQLRVDMSIFLEILS